MDTERVFRVDCDCCCGASLTVLVPEWDKENIYLSYGLSAFYAYQPERWREKLKMLWCILTGKEYTLYEIIIPKDKYEEFKTFINNV